MNECVQIPLTQGQAATIDVIDLPRILKTKWRAVKKGHVWYAYSTSNGFMHQVLCYAPKGMKVDHIDGDGLNNRKVNLRVASNSENQQNQRPRSRAKGSPFKGVSHGPAKKDWVVNICHRGRNRKVTGIANERIASLIYDLLAADRFGEFACFNNKELMTDILKDIA